MCIDRFTISIWWLYQAKSGGFHNHQYIWLSRFTVAMCLLICVVVNVSSIQYRSPWAKLFNTCDIEHWVDCSQREDNANRTWIPWMSSLQSYLIQYIWIYSALRINYMCAWYRYIMLTFYFSEAYFIFVIHSSSSLSGCIMFKGLPIPHEFSWSESCQRRTKDIPYFQESWLW